jgi:hypothetical protein
MATPTRIARPLALALGAASFVSLASSSARADDEIGWDFGLTIESDLRLRLEPKSVGDLSTAQTLPRGVERNQNMLSAQASAGLDNVRAKTQVDLFVFGYQDQLQGIDSLSNIDELQPYRLDVRELYVDVNDLFFDGLDVRIGQQVVQWGVADQFNPTNNLNADDLIDPLLFGKQLGNFMVKGDYWVSEDFSVSAVLVPLFRAARVPTSARLGLTATDRLPFIEDGVRQRIIAERAAAQVLAGKPTIVDQVTIDMPSATLDNMQAALRLAGTILEQDVALSYYNGRTDFPQAVVNHTRQSDTPICGAGSFSILCTQGALLTDVTLAYPRMHVYGLNVTGEAGVGYRFEGALVVPEKTSIKLTNDDLNLGGFQVAAGEYDYNLDDVPGGKRPTVVDDTPFLKWTLGLDYTITESIYANVMWVHGLADEFGAGDWMGGTMATRASGVDATAGELVANCALKRDGSSCATEVLRPRLGDFLVAGIDFKWLDDQLTTRLFTIVEMSGYQFSRWDAEAGKRTVEKRPFYTAEGAAAVIYPEANYNFGNGLELGGGALVQLGKPYTKFGDAAAGGSVGFVRARFTL